MKLPAVWIALAFGAGVVLGTPLPWKPVVWLAAAVAAILAGFFFVRRARLATAWICALAAWVLLGATAASLESASLPANHVTRLIASGRIDTSEPLRWRGVLRSDPVALPRSYRCELDLDEVDAAGSATPITGGLRLTYYENERKSEPAPDLRAGERVEVLVRARLPRNFLNPGARDVRGQLANEGIHLTATLRSAELLRRMERPPLSLAARFARLRGYLLGRIDTIFSAKPEHAAILRAMLLGDRSFVDHDLAVSFQKTAVYHVLVIAGLHVAALAAFVFWVARRRLGLSLEARVAATLVVVATYVAVVEDHPPIARAALMIAFVLAARLLFRRSETLNTIAVAALLLLLARPSAIFDASFQLSFTAVGTIAALGMAWVAATSAPYRRAVEHFTDPTRDAAHTPRATQFRLDCRDVAERLAAQLPSRFAPHAPSLVTLLAMAALRIWEIVLISVAVQVGMLPLMALYFHRVSLSGPLANIPAVTLAGCIVPFGFVALALDALWSPLGLLAGKLVSACVTALSGSVGWFAAQAWGSYRIPAPPVLLVLAFLASVAFLAAVARARLRGSWQLLSAVPAAALGFAIATFPFAPKLAPGKLELTTLDVGQGDSIFAAFPNGRTMLVDGGGLYNPPRAGGYRTGLDIGEQVVSAYLWERGLKALDVVALSHAHNDHLEGLHAVLENFRVGEFWVGRDVDTRAYRALVARAQARGARVMHRHRGETFAQGAVTGIVLWPEATSPAAQGSNNDSLVLRLEHGRTASVLPGDIEHAVEHSLVERGDLLSADFLKVPHHGSRTSTSAEFAARVSPRVAVVSVGEANPFGHPHGEVLARLSAVGTRVLRTDRNGAVTFLSDGTSYHVTPFAGDGTGSAALRPETEDAGATRVSPSLPAETPKPRAPAPARSKKKAVAAPTN